MKLDIIFENNDFSIINKPSGLVVHPFDHSIETTLIDILKESYQEMFAIDNHVKLQDGRTIHLGGIVHKLDRDTSGVMVVAKNETTFIELKKQFREHTIKKIYLAVVEGHVEENTFTIDAPLGRNKKEYKQSVNPSNPRGELRHAVTEVKVLARNKNTTLLELLPLTGRTHQLRAHMAHIGHPIVGDRAYGSTQSSERVILHARSLTFSLQGQEYAFTVPEPVSFL